MPWSPARTSPSRASRRSSALQQLADRAPGAVAAARLVSPVRWMFATPRRRREVGPHAAYLRKLFAWGLQAELATALDRLSKPTGVIDPSLLTVDGLLDPRLGLATSIGAAAQPGLLDGTRFGELPRAMADLRDATGEEAGTRDAAVAAVAAMRAPAVRSALAAMPLETLKEATTDTLRLRAAGDRGHHDRPVGAGPTARAAPTAGDRQRLPRQRGRSGRDARADHRGGASGPARR